MRRGPHPKHSSRPRRAQDTGGVEPRLVSVQALAWLAAEEDRLARFLALTGMPPDRLAEAGDDPAIQEGVLAYLLSDEPLMLAFCEAHDWPPEAPGTALAVLSGGEPEP